MKKTIFTLLAFFSVTIYSQNITNTLGTNGIFSIKDATNTFLSIFQSNGYLNLNYCFKLLNTTSSNIGVIYKGTDRFLHNYGTSNTFLGINSGNFTMTGIGGNTAVGWTSFTCNTTGYYNTAVGWHSLFSNSTGGNNTAVGFNSLSNNTTGSTNTAVGLNSLYYNTTGNDNTALGLGSLFNNNGNQNTALGNYSLYDNSGDKGTAVGFGALRYNTTGNNNTAVGYFSLYSNNTGYENTAVGNSSLQNNTTGFENTAVGFYSLLSNTTGYQNTALGMNSLRVNTTGDNNTAVGINSLSYNTTADNNTALGHNSMMYSTLGYSNTAIGQSSLHFNTSGFENTAVGFFTLMSNTTGNYNTAVGKKSLYLSTTGNYNTALGNHAGYNLTYGTNNTVIGYDAQAPDGSLSNQVRIGNTAVTYAGVQVAWTITSDRRWKQNILPVELGLNFISKLNPVSYTRNNDEKQKTEYGFIAQEIEEVLKINSIDNNGMITVTDEGMYELRYNDLLAPMVKAIQELKAENDGLKLENISLKERLLKLEQMQVWITSELEKMKVKDIEIKEPVIGGK